MKKYYQYKTYGDVWKSARSWRYWLKGRKGVYILLDAITTIAYNDGYEKGQEQKEKDNE
jgi:hypothetical protein